MTPIEWSKVAARVAALWGRSSKWANATELTHDVHSIPLAVAMSAVEDSVGQYAPSPAEIIYKARTHLLPGRSLVTMPGPEDCEHPRWGIIEYLSDGRRRGLCPICKTEKLFPIHGLLMLGELEERRIKSQTQEY